MRLFDLFENENTNLLVIYPGRFHPFHIGHGKVFKYLKQNYKGAQVFIASSGKTDTHKSPFTFDEKKKMMMLAGVDPNGEPAHVQKWTGMADAKPLRDHSYIVTVPTFTFKIQGEPINSATQIRNMIGKADEEQLQLILQDLYGTKNIPQEVMEIFKRKLQPSTMSESWEEPTVYECLLEADYHRELLSDRKLSGGEKRSKAAHFKKLNKHAKSDFVDRYGKDAENIMHAVATKRAKNEADDKGRKNDLDLGFDPKTVHALNDLKVKYPHADNVMAALVADMEDSQKRSKQNDAEHDISIADLEKKIDSLTKELNKLKTTKESQMKITDIVREEITLEDHEDFHENFGYLAFCEEGLFEAEYQGRSVKLNKPMRGDVKKFKVYVKNDKGNVVKVNFGDPNMKIKKSNPKRRKSFRARHNCDNPGPKTKARYWSCRKW